MNWTVSTTLYRILSVDQGSGRLPTILADMVSYALCSRPHVVGDRARHPDPKQFIRDFLSLWRYPPSHFIVGILLDLLAVEIGKPTQLFIQESPIGLAERIG